MNNFNYKLILGVISRSKIYTHRGNHVNHIKLLGIQSVSNLCSVQLSHAISPSYVNNNPNYKLQYLNSRSSVHLYCSATHSVECWSCGHQDVLKNFCSGCQRIQPPLENRTYFDVFELPVDFTIDATLLTKKFRSLQAVFHPDKFTQKSQREQELSAVQSSLVNKAYRVLQQPIARSEYMLALTGRTLLEEEITLDQEFLLSIMEVNEELADAGSDTAVAALGHKNRATRDAMLRSVGEAFDAGDVDAAREVVAKLKYYDNIYNKIIEYERSHGIVS